MRYMSLFVILMLAMAGGCVAKMDNLKIKCEDDDDCHDDEKCVEVNFNDVCKPIDWCEDSRDHCDDDQTCDESTNTCLGQDDYCSGYNPGEYDDTCCRVGNPCNRDDNDSCDCGGACVWDKWDC